MKVWAGALVCCACVWLPCAPAQALRRPILRAFRAWILAAAAETTLAPREPVMTSRPGD